MSYEMMMDTEKDMERAVLKHIEGFAQALLDAVEETLYPDITVGSSRAGLWRSWDLKRRKPHWKSTGEMWS